MQWIQSVESLDDKGSDAGQIGDFIEIAVGHHKAGQHEKEIDKNVAFLNESDAR